MSKNEYDFRNQHKKLIEKQWYLVEIVILDPPYS